MQLDSVFRKVRDAWTIARARYAFARAARLAQERVASQGPLSNWYVPPPGRWVCPVCGWDYIGELPDFSFEICPQCFIEFGFDEAAPNTTYGSLRAQWISEGCPWKSTGRLRPEDWDPAAGLARLEQRHPCPVCGLKILLKPYDRSKEADNYRCGACGFRGGWSDIVRTWVSFDGKKSEVGRSEALSVDKYRTRWIASGMKWSLSHIDQPADWDPLRTLRDTGLEAKGK